MQLCDTGPFSDIKLLEKKPAHMGVLLHYLISNSDPASVVWCSPSLSTLLLSSLLLTLSPLLLFVFSYLVCSWLCSVHSSAHSYSVPLVFSSCLVTLSSQYFALFFSLSCLLSPAHFHLHLFCSITCSFLLSVSLIVPLVNASLFVSLLFSPA